MDSAIVGWAFVEECVLAKIAAALPNGADKAAMSLVCKRWQSAARLSITSLPRGLGHTSYYSTIEELVSWLPNLTSLDIGPGTVVAAEQLTKLGSLDFRCLRSIRILVTHAMTPPAINRLHSFPKLEKLCVNYGLYRTPTNDFFRLRGLKSLELCGYHGLSQEDLLGIGTMESLRHLRLEYCMVSGGALPLQPGKLSSLEIFNCENFSLSPATHVDASHLKKLVFRKCLPFRADDLSTLSTYTGLRELLISSSRLGGKPHGEEGDVFSNSGYGLEFLCLSRHLTRLVVEGFPLLNDAFMGRIACLAELKEIVFAHCNVTHSGLASLSSLTQLSLLDKRSVDVLCAARKSSKQAVLGFLPSLVSLRALGLNNCKWLSNACLDNLVELTQLNALDVSWSNRLVNKRFSDLSSLTSLTSLKAVDASTHHLGNLGSMLFLVDLDLQYCHSLEDDALEVLTSLPALSKLFLTECYRISDAGLRHLEGISGLSELDLFGCHRLTPHGILRLVSRVRLVKLWYNHMGGQDIEKFAGPLGICKLIRTYRLPCHTCF